MQAATSKPDALRAVAAIFVHQQEGAQIVSSEEEASKDCMDNCIQEAAQEGQLA